MSRKDDQSPAVKRRRRERRGPERTYRTFCAVTLDDAALRAIDGAIADVRGRLHAFNWVPPQRWHATIKFYGDVPEHRLGDLATALRSVAGAAVPTRIRGVGAFPNLRDPHVLWVGIDDPGSQLSRLYRRVNDISSELGFEPEERKFRPHITVARARRGGAHPVARELTPLMGADICETTLRELALFTSERRPDGPIYTAVDHIRLGGEGDATT